MKTKDAKQVEAYHAWSYQGIVNLPLFNGYVFNHGTESKANDRTAQHKNDCSKQSYLYEVIYENNDRVFGDKVISKSNDTDYVQKVAERLNNTVLKNSVIKAQLLHEWFESISYLVLKDQRKQGDLNALRASNLSQTECIFVPNIVSRIQLLEAIEYVNTHWYFNNKSLLVSAKPYKDKTIKERKMAAKPLPRAFHRRLIEALKAGKDFTQLLKYKIARVQGVEFAYLISCLNELRNLEKIRVVITADDIEAHKETYDVLKSDPRFELVECDSDEAMVEEYKMNTVDIKPDLDIMNPPYNGNLHLSILETVLQLRQPGSTVVSIQPARWLEDPLAEYKQGTDYKKYKDSIVDKISNLYLIDVMTANNSFHITCDQDLAIYTFSDNKVDFEAYPKMIKNIINKIKDKMKEDNLYTCADFIEYEKVDGWRCETFKVKSLGQATTVKNSSNTYTSDGWEFMISGDKGYYHDGKCSDGRWWTENRQATQNTRKVGEPFAQSFGFKAELGCKNFYTSTHATFFINLVYMLKTDMNLTPVLNHLPYMGDYDTHAWTDEDYCEYFKLDQEESDFMCRKIKDYRVKDFINYIKLN